MVFGPRIGRMAVYRMDRGHEEMGGIGLTDELRRMRRGEPWDLVGKQGRTRGLVDTMSGDERGGEADGY